MADDMYFNIEGSVQHRNKCQKKVLKQFNLPEDFLSEKQAATKTGGVTTDHTQERENIVTKLQSEKSDQDTPRLSIKELLYPTTNERKHLRSFSAQS